MKPFLPFAALFTLTLFPVLLPIAAARPALEAGASYFDLRDARFEPAPAPLQVLQSEHKVVPFIAATHAFNESFALRFSYQYLHDLTASAEFGSPPGDPPSPLAVVVWGRYQDDVHVVSAAPEFRWSLRPRLNLSLAPQLNWVASRGTVAHSSTNALILLRAPYRRNDDGFTLGGSLRLAWSFRAHSALSLGYQYLDLEPSFDRKAHVYSAGWSWQF
jgi:hypothetical protein